jgi:hypothetical protein
MVELHGVSHFNFIGLLITFLMCLNLDRCLMLGIRQAKKAASPDRSENAAGGYIHRFDGAIC